MTSVYLTASSADAAVTAGSGTKWKAGWAPGASATHLNKNSVAGPTAPLQATDGAAGADGTVVSWYTEPLWGVTIAGQIVLSLWTRENATANNVAPSVRIERCSGDGTVLSTIVSETTNHGAGEMGTTAGGASDLITCTAANVTDTALSDGDRLRITLWIDDAAGQGGTGNMASGGRGEFWVNGPNGAQGQAQVQFTEIVLPQAGPNMVGAPETSFTTTTTPKTLNATGALTDDLLVALFGGDNFSTPASAASTSTTSGSTGSWTEVLEALVGNTASPWKSSAWADVTGDGDVTVSLDRTQSSPQVWGGWLAHLRNHGGIGNTAELVDSSSDTVSLTVSEGSLVLAIGIEWDHLAVTEFTPAGAHDIERTAAHTAVSWYAGFWPGQPAGTRNYGIATNSSANFSLTLIEILAPTGSTAVGKDLGLVWGVRAPVGDPLELLWDTRAAVGDPLGLVWDVRQTVGDLLQLVLGVSVAVGDTVQLVWDARAAVGDPLVLQWHTRTAVGDPLELIWGTRAVVGDPLQLVWNVEVIGASAVGKDLGIVWNARAAVAEELQALWDTRSAVGDPLALAWAVTAAVGDQMQLAWNTRALAGDSVGLSWDVRAAAGNSLQLVWDVEVISGLVPEVTVFTVIESAGWSSTIEPNVFATEVES